MYLLRVMAPGSFFPNSEVYGDFPLLPLFLHLLFLPSRTLNTWMRELVIQGSELSLLAMSVKLIQLPSHGRGHYGGGFHHKICKTFKALRQPR